MGLSEFDSVAMTVLGELTSSSRSEMEAVPTCSRANVDCGRFWVAEEANSASCSVAKVLDSMSPALLKEVDATSGSEVEAVDRVSGSKMEAVDSTSGSEADEVVSV